MSRPCPGVGCGGDLDNRAEPPVVLIRNGRCLLVCGFCGDVLSVAVPHVGTLPTFVAEGTSPILLRYFSLDALGEALPLA